MNKPTSHRPTPRPASRPPSARIQRRPGREPIRLPVGNPVRRIRVAMLALAMLASVLVAKAVDIQGLDSSAYATTASHQMMVQRTILANRGAITDRFGEVLATSLPAVNIVADPSQVRTNGKLERAMSKRDRELAAAGPTTIAATIARHVGGDPAEYARQLSRTDTRYVILAKQVPAYTYLQLAQELQALGYVGVYREPAPIRSYPNGSLAANVVGFVIDQERGPGQVGAGGLELAHNAQLSGTEGKEVYQTSPNGKIPTNQNVLNPAQDGATYTLTLDAGLQYLVERRLQQTVDQARAVSGIAITMNVKTGEILALANYPSFDSNKPGAATPANLGNRAVTDAYEPGSVQKVLTMAALADAGYVTPDQQVVVPSTVMSGGRPIGDAFSHGTINLTARGVVANSSNVGTVLLTRQMPKDRLVDYLRDFGLGRKTGIGLPGEAVGSIPGTDVADHSRDQISFGQGLSVTAVQEAAAVAAVVNGGIYHSPTVVRSAMSSTGRPVAVPQGESRRVISPEASAMVVDMMESVVASKVGRHRFPIEGYRTAAKSGTAERIDPTCKCYSGYVASFIGVAPVEDPEILTYVVVDRPQAAIQGSQVAAPAWRDIMQVALPRYGILPSSSPAPQKPIEW